MPLHRVPLDADRLQEAVDRIERYGQEITYMGETPTEYVIVTRPREGNPWQLRSVA